MLYVASNIIDVPIYKHKNIYQAAAAIMDLNVWDTYIVTAGNVLLTM